MNTFFVILQEQTLAGAIPGRAAALLCLAGPPESSEGAGSELPGLRAWERKKELPSPCKPPACSQEQGLGLDLQQRYALCCPVLNNTHNLLRSYRPSLRPLPQAAAAKSGVFAWVEGGPEAGTNSTLVGAGSCYACCVLPCCACCALLCAALPCCALRCPALPPSASLPCVSIWSHSRRKARRQ